MIGFDPKMFLQTFVRRYRLALLSGALFGLSWPNYPYVRTEFLAWAWMVPLFVALKSVKEFRPFIKQVLVATLLTSALGMAWLAMASVKGAFFAFLLGSVVFGAPFAAFFFVRRGLGWRAALWSSPVLWTAMDWLYHNSEGSIGWLSPGMTQSRLWWLIQFADVTGVWGVTFWLVSLNVLIADFLITNRNRIVRNLAIRVALMICLPLPYTVYVFQSQPAGREHLSVLLVQPNVDPWRETDPRADAQSLGRAAALTNRALRQTPPDSVDLIVWPECAVPFVLRREEAPRDFITRQVARWQTPLLTGAFDSKIYSGPEERPPLLKFQGTHAEFFNAAFLLAPEAGQFAKLSHGQSVNISEPYRKRALMPFAERVPFVDRFPALSNLAVDFGLPYSFSPGTEARVFSFNDRQGRPRAIGAAICYEQFYPAQLAEQVRGGAELLAFITNIGWFSQSQGQYEIAAFARIRAIELRRSIAIAANTGQTCLIDPFGRMTAAAEWWSERTLGGQAALSRELSFYVRHPDLFARVCALLAAGLLIAAAFRRSPLKWKHRRRFLQESFTSSPNSP